MIRPEDFVKGDIARVSNKDWGPVLLNVDALVKNVVVCTHPDDMEDELTPMPLVFEGGVWKATWLPEAISTVEVEKEE